MKRTLRTVLLVALLLGRASAEPLVQRLAPDLYAYVSDSDNSCNAVFLVGPTGILVVDTGFDAREADKLLAGIRRISNLPIRYIVNTHYHPDHQGGNGIVGPAAVVVSSDWTRDRTVQFVARDVPMLQQQLQGAELESVRSARFLPATLTLGQELTIYLGEHIVEIRAVGHAHTPGDVFVYFPQQRVIAAGDLFLSKSCPDMEDGDITGWLRALETLLILPVDALVPGHFEVASREQVQRFHDYLADLRQQVERLRQAGASVEQVRRRVRMEKYADFRQYPQYHATFADNAEAVFRQLAEEEKGLTSGRR